MKWLFTKKNNIKCCFCNNEIPEFPKGWKLGNNAEPVVKDGRCCDDCNWKIVVPTRMAQMGMITDVKEKGD